MGFEERLSPGLQTPYRLPIKKKEAWPDKKSVSSHNSAYL